MNDGYCIGGTGYYSGEGRPIYPKPLDKDGRGVFKVTTPPTVEPITVDEVKYFGRIDGDFEDSFIEGLIKGSRQLAEPYLGRSILSQTITYAMDFWPGYVIILPRPNLIAITKIVTLDESDTETEYDSSNYYTDTISEPGRLIVKQGATLPIETVRSYGAYQIVYTAGYGTSGDDVPESLKTGLKLWVMNGYENRTLSKDPPPEARGYLDDQKIMRGVGA